MGSIFSFNMSSFEYILAFLELSTMTGDPYVRYTETIRQKWWHQEHEYTGVTNVFRIWMYGYWSLNDKLARNSL